MEWVAKWRGIRSYSVSGQHLLGLDELRTRRKSVLGEVWIRGKLLYAVVIKRLLHRQMGRDWIRMDRLFGSD